MMSEGTNSGGGTTVVPTCSTTEQRRLMMIYWSLSEYYQAHKVITSSSCVKSIASIPLTPTFNVFLLSSPVSYIHVSIIMYMYNIMSYIYYIA